MRSYPVPGKLRQVTDEIGPLTASACAGSLTTEQLEQAAALVPGTPLGAWATRLLNNEASSTLEQVIGDGQVVPRGVLATGLEEIEDDIVVGLVVGDRTLTVEGWLDEVLEGEQIDLDGPTAAFVASALDEGSSVVLRAWYPMAFISAAAPPTPADPELRPAERVTGEAPEALPKGSVVVAVVDELDRDAVLEQLAITPGPGVMRRHDGQWIEDDGWLVRLRGVRPPPLVELDEAQVANVSAQVDEATAGQPFEPAEAVTGSVTLTPWAAAHSAAADQLAVELALVAARKGRALLADAGGAKGAAGAERLRRYWMTGEGSLKIRWGTPGDWTRCVRQLRKHLGQRAKGYCSLLHSRKTGQWTGSKIHRKTKGVGAPKNPKVVAEAIAKQLEK